MTVAHINALQLLGKQVSFVYKEHDYSFDCSGVITDLVFNIFGCTQISLDEGDFYSLSDISDLKIS